jgi:hypothetical protein
VIHKLNNSTWNKEELPDHWRETIRVYFHKKRIKMIAVIIAGYQGYKLNTKFYPITFFQV